MLVSQDLDDLIARSRSRVRKRYVARHVGSYDGAVRATDVQLNAERWSVPVDACEVRFDLLLGEPGLPQIRLHRGDISDPVVPSRVDLGRLHAGDKRGFHV